ncbi:hypothetical protein EKO04_006295 [Ascochyta lentis]|uniref:Peptidase S1 domain-containing protein n=1 Tax=Ascochyta lentis TaxID=205686 RepID=A0A8H7MI78_9PLEO|nr:hypothetical protein EKO04_006295 [Ascochyta lentis]
MHPKSVLAGLLAPALILGASFAEKDSEDRNKSSSNIIQPRIVGGRYALEGEFPFVVSVQSVGLLGLFASHLCGGSLLNANTVLSAAHCFYDRSASSFRIRAGSLDKASGGILVRVSSIKIHPNYDASSSEDLATSFDYDVAILKLATSIPMSSTIDYVSVAASGSDPVASTDVTTAGWSFPLASESGFANKYGYAPPNEDYRKLFWRQATVLNSQHGAFSCPPSARWLIPDEARTCKPVFIAHSVLLAIWLLRETLAEDALPNNAWFKLVFAAQDLASTRQLPEPSQTEAPKESENHKEPVPGQAGQDEPARTSDVTNKNRHAKRAQVLKLDAAQAKKKLELGLIAPPKKAPHKEHSAYRSISQQDKPLISWILKQPIDKDNNLYSSAAAPYITASSIVNKARAISNATS